MAVVPANMRWSFVGFVKAEYQISAYCVIPELDVVTFTLNDGIAEVGCSDEIVGAGTVPKNVGSPIPVFGAG